MAAIGIAEEAEEAEEAEAEGIMGRLTPGSGFDFFMADTGTAGTAGTAEVGAAEVGAAGTRDGTFLIGDATFSAKGSFIK